MDDAKQRILAAAEQVLLANPGSLGTVETVARKAGVAKGLVAYHFGSKQALFDAAATAILERRQARWSAALATPDPHAAIDACWRLARAEAGDGTAAFCTGRLTDWSTSTVVTDFGAAVVGLLKRAGQVPTIPDDEIGTLAAVTLLHLGSALAGGAEPRLIEAAHAAFWAAAFGLCRSATPGGRP